MNRSKDFYNIKCFFCGRNDAWIDTWTPPKPFFVSCDCGASGQFHFTKEDAIAEWNKLLEKLDD